MTGRPLDPELYLAEARWVHSMARQLLRDEHAADDVVQEVWLASRHSGPVDGASPRAWIRSVARKLTLRRRRDEAARRAHELSLAPPADAPGPETAVERMELQRRLAEAVLALEEPYRTAVILRHLDGLSARAIARREGLSEDAARQRVARGIARLRARLDRDFEGGRRAWALGLLELTRRSGPGWAPPGPLTSAVGGAAVVSKTTVGLALSGATAIALLVAIEGSWATAPRPETATEIDTSLARPLEEPRRAAPVIGAPDSTADDARRAAAPTTAAVDARSTWRGLVVDRAGRPVEGAPVWLTSVEGEALFSDTEPAMSDALGRFVLRPDALASAQTGGGVFLRVEHAHYLPAQVPAEDAPDETTITLLALPVLTGRLVPPPGSSLPERAEVTAIVVAEGERDDQRFETEPDQDGRYEIVGLPPGRLIAVKLAARGYRESKLELDRPLAPEATEVLDLELDPGAVVEGRVLDAVTGEPLVDAEVWADGWSYGGGELFPTARTDGAGRFRLRGVADDVNVSESGQEYVVLRVYARTERHASARTSLHGRGYDANRHYEIELRLQPSDGRIAGVVEEANGTPASGVRVRVADSGANLQFGITDGAGRFAFDDLRPGIVGLLAWRPLEDLERAAVLARDVPLQAGEHVDLRLTLVRREPARIAGRLTDPGGRPAAGVRLEARLIFSGESVALNVDEVSAFSDERGRYAFEGLPAGRYDVVPRPVNRYDDFCRRPHARRLDLEPGDDRREIDFVVGGCASWEGRIADGETHPAAFRVHLIDPLTGDTIESTTPDGEGGFRLDELAGHFDLVLYRGEVELSRLRVGPEGASGLVLAR